MITNPFQRGTGLLTIRHKFRIQPRLLELFFVCQFVGIGLLSADVDCLGAEGSVSQAKRPNILFVLTDDLGYGDVGVFWQNARRERNNRAEPWHLTPHIDKVASEGIQLRHHYCPASVCAPSRASFLLGVHQGHANVRNNQFDKMLEDNHTLATVLDQAGYATACIGKWGLQGKASDTEPNGWPGHPINRGFDFYFGYLTHRAGHAHYPKEDGKRLYDGTVEVSADYDACYTTDLFTARTKKWISDHRSEHPEQPFFLFLAYDTPHAKFQLPPSPYPEGGGKSGGVQWIGQPGQMINTAKGVPDSYVYDSYSTATWDHDSDPTTPEELWPDVFQRFASSVRRIDDCVGDLLQYLTDLGIDENTLVVFTSDNGPTGKSRLEESHQANFFDSYGPFDGIKRDLWEGGIRVGALARWPGGIAPMQVSNEPSAFWDWMPTFAELAGVPAPARTDGVSLVPTLRGVGRQEPSQVYIEYYQGAKTPNYPEFAPAHRGRTRKHMQAIRIGNHMGVRYRIGSHADPFEIYDMLKDPQQKTDLAADLEFEELQQKMKDTVLRVRRPDADAPRPFDDELIPAVEPVAVENGVRWLACEMTSKWVAKIDDMTPSTTGTHSRPALEALPGQTKSTSLLFTGYINAPVDGDYTFSLVTSKGALLRLHDATIIDADFGYVLGSEVVSIVKLQAGLHPFRLYTNHSRPSDAKLLLKWSYEGISKQEIPATAFFRDKISPVPSRN